MNIYTSNLAPLIESFIEFKNALGIQYETSSYYLKQLDIYNYSHGNASILTKEIAEGWSLQYAVKTAKGSRNWISPVREFGRYLRSIGYPTAYVLDDRFKMQSYHAEVYLMTEAEIQAFFNECDRFVLRHKAAGRPYVLPALYRFLYCCGTRCGEARNLKCSDTHLDKGYVDILQSKGYKDRRLFLSDELIEYLQAYDKAIRRSFPSREYFFTGKYGGICSSCTLSANFRKIWTAAGLRWDGRIKPRAYDFRHHFACANIMRWSLEGKDVHAMLPYLMRYMGHSSIESTYYYMHLIPDYFPQYIKLTTPTGALIPEVEEYEE